MLSYSVGSPSAVRRFDGAARLALRQAHHLAVLAHELADGGHGLPPGEAAEVVGRLGVATALLVWPTMEGYFTRNLTNYDMLVRFRQKRYVLARCSLCVLVRLNLILIRCNAC